MKLFNLIEQLETELRLTIRIDKYKVIMDIRTNDESMGVEEMSLTEPLISTESNTYNVDESIKILSDRLLIHLIDKLLIERSEDK